MNKVFLLVCFLLSLLVGNAQTGENWQIFYNKKQVFKGTPEMEVSAAKLKKVRLKNSDIITIKYNTENLSKGWRRTFYINDSTDQNIKTIEMNEQSGSISVTASAINDLINKKTAKYIYTMSLPKDKALAARIRVRRVLLCKIDWN